MYRIKVKLSFGRMVYSLMRYVPESKREKWFGKEKWITEKVTTNVIDTLLWHQKYDMPTTDFIHK